VYRTKQKAMIHNPKFSNSKLVELLADITKE
jgi:hypothetical protein